MERHETSREETLRRFALTEMRHALNNIHNIRYMDGILRIPGSRTYQAEKHLEDLLQLFDFRSIFGHSTSASAEIRSTKGNEDHNADTTINWDWSEEEDQNQGNPQMQRWEQEEDLTRETTTEKPTKFMRDREMKYRMNMLNYPVAPIAIYTALVERPKGNYNNEEILKSQLVAELLRTILKFVGTTLGDVRLTITPEKTDLLHEELQNLSSLFITEKLGDKDEGGREDEKWSEE